MTSSRQRGNQAERDAEKRMVARGWLVERARGVPIHIGPGRVIVKHVDFYGAFDFIAICSPGTCDYHTAPGWHLIQVTAGPTSGNVSVRKAKIEGVYPSLPLGVSAELWWFRTGRRLKTDRVPRGWHRERLMGETWNPVPDSLWMHMGSI